MTCDEVKPLLNASMDEEIDPIRRAAIDSHIDVCPSCATDLKNLERARFAIR